MVGAYLVNDMLMGIHAKNPFSGATYRVAAFQALYGDQDGDGIEFTLALLLACEEFANDAASDPVSARAALLELAREIGRHMAREHHAAALGATQ